jgi:hypothetical protein
MGRRGMSVQMRNANARHDLLRRPIPLGLPSWADASLMARPRLQRLVAANGNPAIRSTSKQPDGLCFAFSTCLRDALVGVSDPRQGRTPRRPGLTCGREQRSRKGGRINVAARIYRLYGSPLLGHL